jgi:hypothetical protein
MTDKTKWSNAVIRVGDGRGFVVNAGHEALVITAAHCLPELPPAHGLSYLRERTFDALLGAIGEEPTVSAECLFVDPVADLAVVGPPDGQELWDEWKDYQALIEGRKLPVGDVALIRELREITIPGHERYTILGNPEGQCSAWMLALSGEWFRCDVKAFSRALMATSTCDQHIVGGMSGSPIVNDQGEAIGIVCLSENGHQPFLARDLPAWVLDELKQAEEDEDESP